MNIDHHVQLTLLRLLSKSEEPVRYSDLKEDGMENSLFSYHLNKLIDRKMIQKIDEGYILTVEGARWLNDNGIALRSKATSHVFLALVVQNQDGEYLVRQRSGQFKEMINDYMLPSIAYTDETDLSDQIDEAIETFIPHDALLESVDYGFVQIKAVYTDATKRSLFHVTLCTTRMFKLETRSSSDWFAWGQLVSIDHPSATILREIIQYTNESKNRHSSPTIVG